MTATVIDLRDWQRQPAATGQQAPAWGQQAPTLQKLLLVSRDSRFVDDLRAHLPEMDLVPLTEATTLHALSTGSALFAEVSAVVLDGTVSGALRLRLYDRMRPLDRVVFAPIIFARSGFAPARSESHHGVDLYLPESSAAREVAWWTRALLGTSGFARPEAPAPVRALVLASAARSGPPSRRARYGWVANAGLWGVVAALTALIFWPVSEGRVLGEALRTYVRAMVSAPATFAEGAAPTDSAARTMRR